MRTLSTLIIMMFLAGCAGMQQHSTGVPASGGSKFYFHIEQEAQARGLTATRSEPSTTRNGHTSSGGVVVRLDNGWLQYSESQGEVILLLKVKGAKKLPPAELEVEQASLKKLSDDLIAGARSRAESANAFD